MLTISVIAVFTYFFFNFCRFFWQERFGRGMKVMRTEKQRVLG